MLEITSKGSHVSAQQLTLPAQTLYVCCHPCNYYLSCLNEILCESENVFGNYKYFPESPNIQTSRA